MADNTFNNNGGDFKWSTPTNWSTNAVPNISQTVDIGNYAVKLDTDPLCVSVAGGTGELLVDTVPISITNGVQFTVPITFSQNTTVSGAVAFDSSVYVVSATLILSGNPITMAGTVIVGYGASIGGSLEITGNVAVSNTTFSLGEFGNSSYGNLLINGGTLLLTDVTLATYTDSSITSTGTFNIDGTSGYTLYDTSSASLGGSMSFGANVSLTMNSSNTLDFASGCTAYMSGTLAMTTGACNIYGSVLNTGTTSYDGGALSIEAAGSYTSTGVFSVNSSPPASASTLTIRGSFSLNGATASISGASVLMYDTGSTVYGTFVIENSASCTLTASAAMNISQYSVLTVASSATLVMDSCDITNSGTININSAALNANGTCALRNYNAVNVYSGGGGLTFTGTTAIEQYTGVLTITGASATVTSLKQYEGLIVIGASGTLVITTALTVGFDTYIGATLVVASSGLLGLNAGTVTTVDYTGTIKLYSAPTIDSTASIVVGAAGSIYGYVAWTMTGTELSNTAGGTVALQGGTISIPFGTIYLISPTATLDLLNGATGVVKVSPLVAGTQYIQTNY